MVLQQLQLGNITVVTPYDVEHASPKVLPCTNDEVTNGVWYSIKGDGTEYHVWSCLNNQSSELYYTPYVDVYTDDTCKVTFFLPSFFR